LSRYNVFCLSSWLLPRLHSMRGIAEQKEEAHAHSKRTERRLE
jgi:hypothetical protein